MDGAPDTQICGACGQPWTGEKCGQANNGWQFQTCYPVGQVRAIADLEADLDTAKCNTGKACADNARLRALLKEAMEALEPFAKAFDAVDAIDPLFPERGACLRACFDYFVRSLGRDNEEIVDIDSVRFGDLRRARDLHAKLAEALRT